MGLFRRKPPAPTPENVTTVILAGGAASRFGSQKGLARLDGRPLVRWVVACAAAVSAKTLLVLEPGADATVWRKALGDVGLDPRVATRKATVSALDIVFDEKRHAGPVAGVDAALEDIKSPFALLMAVDMPLLRPDLLIGLMERLSGHEAVAYHLDGWWRPFPGLWRTASLKAAVDTALDRGLTSLHALLDLVDARPLGPEFLELFDPGGATLASLDTPEDLARAEALLAGRRTS